MIIINSGAYVIAEFQIEFGKIPPTMLPIGNRKLIEHQIQYLKLAFPADQKIVVSLPEDYALSLEDADFITQLGVTVVPVPVNFSLAESVLYVLNTAAGSVEDDIRLLHGDTLVEKFPSDADVVGVARTKDNYAWEVESEQPESNVVWCGYFSFSSGRALMKALALSQGSFVKAVRLYEKEKPLTLHQIKTWLDLGHINTYFRSRSKITTQRAFNELAIDAGVVIKKAIDSIKIEAEANWFSILPAPIRRYVPQIIDQGRDADDVAFYSTEYLTLTPLSEVFVHGRHTVQFWGVAFSLLAEFMGLCGQEKISQSQKEKITVDTSALYKEKTQRRLSQFSEQSHFDLDAPAIYADTVLPSVNEIAAICIKKTLAIQVLPGILHGDLCLGNILFDSRADSIKVIDPRGINDAGEMCLFGDQKYDLAKLLHSIVGLYDFIIAGRYLLAGDPVTGVHIKFDESERIVKIQQLCFQTGFLPGIRTQDAMPLTVLLFLSMLPLHRDRPDRQQAMLANALRLFGVYVADPQ